MSDVDAICGLVNYYAERGKMLHRSLESVCESLRDFLVSCRDGQVVGCAALCVWWRDLGEIRSLAVEPARREKGIGSELVRQAIADARGLGLRRVFALTYEADFFEKFGFCVVDKESLPAKVWRDCIHCPRADACEELAVLLELTY